MDVFWINTNAHYKIWRDFLIICPQEHIYPKLEIMAFKIFEILTKEEWKNR